MVLTSEQVFPGIAFIVFHSDEWVPSDMKFVGERMHNGCGKMRHRPPLPALHHIQRAFGSFQPSHGVFNGE